MQTGDQKLTIIRRQRGGSPPVFMIEGDAQSKFALRLRAFLDQIETEEKEEPNG